MDSTPARIMHFKSLIELIVYYVYNTIGTKASGYTGGAATPEEKGFQNLSDQGEQQFLDTVANPSTNLAALVHETMCLEKDIACMIKGLRVYWENNRMGD